MMAALEDSYMYPVYCYMYTVAFCSHIEMRNLAQRRPIPPICVVWYHDGGQQD